MDKQKGTQVIPLSSSLSIWFVRLCFDYGDGDDFPGLFGSLELRGFP